MNKFQQGQKVKVRYARIGVTTVEDGEVVEVLPENQYRVNIGWLLIVQPESAISAA